MVLAELFGDLYADDAARHRAASYLRAHQKCYDDLAAMLDPQALAAIPGHALEDWVTPYLEDPCWKSFVGRLMSINLLCKGAHHILGKVDALSGPFGVLPRAPLFDRDVVELAFATPPQLKLHGTIEKYLLKEAVRDLLPREIIERPKSGMLVPVQGWFRGRCCTRHVNGCSKGWRPGACSAATISNACSTDGCPACTRGAA